MDFHFLAGDRVPGPALFQGAGIGRKNGLGGRTLDQYEKRRDSNESRLMESGGDLSSRAVSSQVLSALKGLTSVFGMGTGGTPSPLPPEIVSFLSRTLTTAHLRENFPSLQPILSLMIALK